jgi:hypothetical protein
MSRADRRTGEPAVGESSWLGAFDRPGWPAMAAMLPGQSVRPSAGPPVRPTCNRCGFAVISRPWGCKNPCPNCGTVYPLGDCSD